MSFAQGYADVSNRFRDLQLRDTQDALTSAGNIEKVRQAQIMRQMPQGQMFPEPAAPVATPAVDPRTTMPSQGRPAAGKPTEYKSSPDQLPNEMAKFLRQGTMPSATPAAPVKSRAPMWAGEDEIAQQKFAPGQQVAPIGRAAPTAPPTPREFDRAKFDSLMAQNNTRTPVQTPQGQYDARLAAQGGTASAPLIQRVMQREGGYVANDAGKGPTNYGINSAANPEVGDVSKLTPQQAQQIYKTKYWDAIGADNLPENMREIAFDGAVNQGVSFMRQALQAAGNDPQKLLQIRAQRYQQTAASDPSKAAYLPQWMARLQSIAGGQPQGAPQGAPQTAAAPQPGQPQQTGGYSPEQMVQLAQQRVTQGQQQLDYLRQLAQVTRDPAQLEKLRTAYSTVQSGMQEAQLYNMAAEGRITPQQFQQLSETFRAQQAARAQKAYDAQLKTQGELAVEGAKGANAMQLAQLRATEDRMTAIENIRAQGYKVIGSQDGNTYATRGQEVYVIKPDGTAVPVKMAAGNQAAVQDFISQ